MAIYLYRGRDNSGAAVEGSLQAGSREVAVSQLMQRGITPLKIQQQKVCVSTKPRILNLILVMVL